MFPNKFVIIWDGCPVGLQIGADRYPYKISEHNSVNGIKFWDTKEEAKRFMEIFTNIYPERIWEVKEIQFRIVG